MSDPKIGLDGRRGPRGERGERGERGHRGRDGHDGHDGSTGPTGSTGFTGATGPTGPGVAPVIAAAVVNGTTATYISQQGFTGAITHVGVGVYDLLLLNPPANLNNAVVEVTQISSAAGQEGVTFSSPNHVVVHTFNGAGVAADRDFMVTVYDLT